MLVAFIEVSPMYIRWGLPKDFCSNLDSLHLIKAAKAEVHDESAIIHYNFNIYIYIYIVFI